MHDGNRNCFNDLNWCDKGSVEPYQACNGSYIIFVITSN